MTAGPIRDRMNENEKKKKKISIFQTNELMN